MIYILTGVNGIGDVKDPDLSLVVGSQIPHTTHVLRQGQQPAQLPVAIGATGICMPDTSP